MIWSILAIPISIIATWFFARWYYQKQKQETKTDQKEIVEGLQKILVHLESSEIPQNSKREVVKSINSMLAKVAYYRRMRNQ